MSLPERYSEYWGTDFWRFARAAMRDGMTILDIGGGRRPTVAPADRPRGTHYIGLDVSGAELDAAPPGSYDEKVAADAASPVQSLAGRADLIVAWQVLEHFRDLRGAAATLRDYAADDGWFVAMLSGRRAVFAVANRLLPERVSEPLVARLMRRPQEEVFPAYYDHCDADGLREAFGDWGELHVVPLWNGADYFRRLGPLRGAYLRYEDWALKAGRENLATHYVVAARRLSSPGSRPAGG